MRFKLSKMENIISESRKRLLTKNRNNLLLEPNTEKFYEKGNGNRLAYCVASMQGWRSSMEDFHSIKLGLGDKLNDWSYFAVFDGHYGSAVAKFCSQHLLENWLTDELEKNTKNVILKGFLGIDQKLQSIPKVLEEKSGTTSTLAIISPSKIYIANLGDSRAVFYSKICGLLATKDHKPFMPDEKLRIENAGGVVKRGRINGKISVSRTLGDFNFKLNTNLPSNEQQISSEPEVFIFDRHKFDKFLILATDGIWRTLKTSEICKFVEDRLSKNMDLNDICREIIDVSFSKVSRGHCGIGLQNTHHTKWDNS